MRNTVRLSCFVAFAVLVEMLSAATLNAQTSTVQLLGTVTASQAFAGLGFNLDPGAEWEWAAAAAAGATHARIQCSWANVEKQTAPPENKPASPQYVEDPNCAAAFGFAAKYGIQPTVVAAYGPPFHQILTVTVPDGAPAGALSLNVSLVSSVGGDSLAQIAFPSDYICPADTGGRCIGQISSKHSYQGVLITGVTLKDSTHATLKLASALTNTLPASAAPFAINEILYPSVASQSEQDASVVAYGNYVDFLARDMAAHGLKGDIEIWNEPPWTNDPWDFRAGLYDAGLYPGAPTYGANFGFAAHLMQRTLPPGITATWNGTSGNGSASLLLGTMATVSGQPLLEPSQTITRESFHPYGGRYGNPEETMFVSSCLQGTAEAKTSPRNNPFSNGMNCFLAGQAQSSNFMMAIGADMAAKLTDPRYGLGHSVTETNDLPPAAGMRMQQARAIMRQYIGFEADGITPIEFYKLYDGAKSDPSFSFVDQVGTTGTYIATPAYTALAGFLADIKPISNAPVGDYPASTLPSVTSYTGMYALGTAHIVGSRKGAAENSDAFIIWQMSSNRAEGTSWYSLPTNPGAQVKVNLPANTKVTAVVNVTTRASVDYVSSGNEISFQVADDPVEVLVDPSSVTAQTAPSYAQATTSLTLTANPESSVYGNQVLLTAVLAPYNSKTYTTNGERVTFYSGGTLLGTATLSSGVAILDTTALPRGTDKLSASYSGDAHFANSAAGASIAVSPAIPHLAITPIPNQIYGSAPVSAALSSNSLGQITAKLVSGPARISAVTNSSVTVISTGVGEAVLQINQAAWGNFAATSVQGTFLITAANPNLTFTPVPDRVYGSAPFSIRATSASAGSITYSVASGPASLSGNAVTVTGAGKVVLTATQAATPNYKQATAQTTFTVSQATPKLNFTPIASQTYGTQLVSVHASSASPGSITYTVLSGPASIRGDVIMLTGSGTVVVQVNQAATTNYGTATAQTSFNVSPKAAALTLAPVAQQTYGNAPFKLVPSTTSPAPVTYSVLSGPASLAGSTVTITGIGSVVIQVTQPATNAFSAASARVSFSILPQPVGLKLPPLDIQKAGATVKVAATSPSPATISYQIVSGPATGSTNKRGIYKLVCSGAGTVILRATQAAAGNYAAAATQASFRVEAK